MVRNSADSSPAARLRSELSALIRTYQRNTDAFDQAVSECLRVNRTDLRCLDWLAEQAGAGGDVTPKMLAEGCALTPSTVTSVLDRLERAGYVRRIRDTGNRRQVLLQLTPELLQRTGELLAPVVADAEDQLSTFSAAELAVLIRFFTSAIDRHPRRLERIREGALTVPAAGNREAGIRGE